MVDTDSNYLCLDALVKKVFPDGAPKEKVVNFIDKFCREVLAPFIRESFEELATMMNAFEQRMSMKRENIADVTIITGKKKYIMNVWDSEGVRYETPKVKMTGIEAVRSNTPFVCREYIKKSIEIIVNGTEEQLHEYVAKCREAFNGLRFEEVGKPTGVNGMKDYADKYTVYRKGTPMHVRAALLYNKVIKEQKLDKKFPLINDGDKIKYTYMKVPNPLRENVFACTTSLPSVLKLEQYIDFDTQFAKTFLSPLEIILKEIGWHHEKRLSLEEFFT
jgi:DNA polymerase elongation subunit (family B)